MWQLKICGNQAQRIAAEAGDVHRLGHAAMNGRGCVCDEMSGCCGNTAGADVKPQRDVAGDEHRDQICHRGSGDEQTRRVFREAEELGDPARDLPLDLNGNVIAPAAIGVQSCGEHLRHHADRRAAAIDPAHETRMHIALRVRHHLAQKLGVHIGEVSANTRRGRLKVLPHSIRNRLPHRPLANVFDVAKHVV